MHMHDRLIGGDVPFIIAEAGVNHDGDVDVAHRLITIAAESGADAVKFQTFAPESLVAAGAGTTPYQQRAGGVLTQAEMLASLTLPPDAWVDLSHHARESGVLFLSSPFDASSAEMLVDLGAPALKTGSGELTNLPFLRDLAAFGLPLLISTGMADWDEVDSAVAATSDTEIALFHCVSAYPAPIAECNLRVLPAMQERYDVPVGWSDHTLGLTAAVAATSLGARLFEKHFTIDSSAPGPDHAASLEPEQLRAYVARIHETVSSLGDGIKRRVPSEEENAPLVRRSWHARRDLAAGAVLDDADIVALRPESGIPVAMDIVGSRLARAVPTGQALVPADVAPPSDQPG